jgi:PAS domain S-box-containing protein
MDHWQNQSQQMLNEQGQLLALIASGSALEDCLVAICEAVARLHAGTRACFLLADAQGLTFARSVTPALPPLFGQGLKDVPINELCIGTCGEAVYRGEPIGCADIANDSRWSQDWRSLCIAHGILACHSEPVMGSEKRALGSLMLCFAEPRLPTAWERQLAQFGTQIASLVFERDRATAKQTQVQAEYRQAASALQLERDRLAFVLSATGLGLWFNTLPLEQLNWDERTRELFFVRPHEEATIDLFWSRLHPDDREPTRLAIEEALQQHKLYQIDHRAINPETQEIRWIRSTGQATYADDGTAIRFDGINYDVTERIRGAEELRQSEAEFRLLANTVPQIVWTNDAQGQIIYVNDQWREFSGLTLAETADPEAVQQVIHPDDRHRAFAQWETALQTGASYQVEARMRQAQTGLYHWFLVRNEPFKDAAGRVLRWFGTSTDITERKRRELQTEFLAEVSQELILGRSEADLLPILAIKIGEFFEASNCAFAKFELAEQKAIVYADWRKESDQPSWVGEYPVAEFAIPELWQRLISAQPIVVDDVYSDPSTAPYAERYQALQVRSFLNAPFVSDRGIQFAIVLHRSQPYHWRSDETELLQELAARVWASLERDRVAADLQQKTAILNVINEASPTPIFIKNRQGQIIYANPVTLAVLGKTAEETIGARDCDLYPHLGDAIRVMENDRRIMESGQTEVFEESPDGIRTFLSIKAPYYNSAGEVIGLIGLSNDISDRVRLEHEREHLLQREQAARAAAEQANRIKDEFLAVLSHELRTPMNPIMGWANLLKSGRLSPERIPEAIAVIERNAKLQMQLIDDLLDISRIIQGKLTLEAASVDLQTVIQAAIDTVRLASEAKAISIHTALSPCLVTGNAGRLQQAVWNLLSNAIKFTPKGGQIHVTLSATPTTAQVQVTDTGKGISAEFLPHVFEHFRQEDGAITRQFGGLGLGLAIARQVVELHGGQMSVASPGEGQGATFTMELPLAPTALEPVHPERAEKSTLPDLSHLRILAVDDEPDSLYIIAFMLEHAGATVSQAVSGFDALAKIQQSREELAFDVLVSDIGMPEMDGYLLLQQIRQQEQQEQLRSLPAIALTAYAGEHEQQQAIAAGFDRHLPKPVEPAQLIQAIFDLYNRSAST